MTNKNTHPLTDAEVQQFHRDGYLIRKAYYDREEMDLLLQTARADHNMLSHSMPVKDASGKQSKLSLWNHPGDDIYGMFSRGHRMVDAMEQLLDDEVYQVLRARNAALCVADTEDGTTPIVATADFGYLRLRDRAYGSDELARWAETAGRADWRDAFVYFKHEESGTGPALARELIGLLAPHAPST